MLSKTENRIMCYISSEAKTKDSLLLNPTDVLSRLGLKGVSVSQLEGCLEGLSADGYFDLIYSDRHGERVYCILVTNRGKHFERNGQQIKRNLLFKLVLTVSFAILSFIIGLILKAIF